MITAVLGASMSGDFLSVQLVYQGKSKSDYQLLSFHLSMTLTLSRITGLMNL